MTFSQIQALSATALITEHRITTGTKTALLDASPRYRILYFGAADVMLEMNTLLLSIEADTLTVIAPDTPAEIKFGYACCFWQLAFSTDEFIPLVDNMFYRWATNVYLRGDDSAVLRSGFSNLRMLAAKSELDDPTAKLHFCLAFGDLLLNCAGYLASGATRGASEQNTRIDGKVHRYLDAHYTESINLAFLESIFFVSRYHICRQFSKQYGVSVLAYVRQLRVAHATELLRTTNLSVADVGKACGYNNVQRFHAAFLQQIGCTPLQFRLKSMR